MKKSLLSIACIFALMSPAVTMAQEVSSPVYSWGALLDSPTAGDMANAIATDVYGNLYYLGTEGSKGEQRDLTYGSEVIGTGAEYSGTSYNYNFVLVKTDKSGKLLWSVTSTQGESASGNGTVTPLSDGSVIVTAKIRPTDGAIAKGFVLSDKDGNELKVEWPDTDTRVYKGLVMKFDADGKLLASNVIELDDAPQPGTDKVTADALDIYAATKDDADNVYVGARFRSKMTLVGADDKEVSVSARNIVGWNGDSQATNGDMIIIKLDSDGQCLATFTSETTITASKTLSLDWSDGSLYALATVQGQSGQVMTIGQKSVTINEYASPLLISMTADLSVNWCDIFTASQVEAKNPALQSTGLSVIDGNIWLTGMFNGAFYFDGKSVASEKGSTPREGLLAKINAADGKVLGATTSAADYGIKVPGGTANCITGFLDAFVNPGDESKVYVYGYGMNANVGVFVRAYNAETLVSNPDTEAWNLVTGGGAPSAQGMAYNAEEAMLYVTARGNAKYNVMGGEAPAVTAGYGFGQLLAAFNMPFEKVESGVTEVSEDTEETTPVYYNLQGIEVKNPANGLFIRKQGNKVDKVIL